MKTKLNLNPWFAMWTQPQRTIREIIKTNPKMGFFFLAGIWALQFFFVIISYHSFNFSINRFLTIFIAVILSPIIGGVCFYIFGWLLYITGKWLKGKASQSHATCAFAWSRLPLIIDLIMWFGLSVFVSEIVFNAAADNVSFIFINLITLVTSVWSFVLLAGAVKEIQQFSLWKSILNVAIVYLMLTLFCYLVLFFYLI